MNAQARPDDPEAHYALASYHYAHGNYAVAEQAFRRVTELTPRDPLAFENLGVVLKAQDKTEEAIAAYDEALEWGACSNATIRNMAILYKKAGDRRMAEEYCDQYMTRAIESREPRMLLSADDLALHVKNDEPLPPDDILTLGA